MDKMNQEIGAFGGSEAQAQGGLVGSDPADTWNHDTLTEFADLCSEECDLLNFDTLQVERKEGDHNQMPCSAGKNIQYLVESHLGYAHGIAGGVLKRCPAHVEREDVNRAAEFGLVQAAYAYDPSRGISFTTFAYYRIKGAIYDDLRTSWRAAKFDEAANEYMREYSEASPRATTPAEAYEEIKNIVSSVANSYLLSLQGMQDEPEEQTTESPLESVLRGEERDLIAAALEQLPAKNREVLRKYYFEDLSLEEIGSEMGLSRSWVCRLHAKGLALMGESLRNPKFRFTPRAPEGERHIPSALIASLTFA